MKKTNQQKWDELHEILETKKNILVDSIFPTNKPTAIYTAYWNSIVEEPITRFGLMREPYVTADKKITAKDIESLTNFINTTVLTEEKLLVYFKASNYSGAYKLEDINIKAHRSFNREDLIELHNELHNTYAPREGYEKCEYCGRQVLKEELKTGTVLYRTRYGSEPILGQYCSDKCISYDQMAHDS